MDKTPVRKGLAFYSSNGKRIFQPYEIFIFFILLVLLGFCVVISQIVVADVEEEQRSNLT